MSKRILKGKVVSSKNNKTIVVEVVRKFQHPFFGKVISRTKKYHAHDEENQYQVGQRVIIEETRPLSKRKSFVIVSEAAADK